jgi:general secretion pathway protein E
MSPAELRRVIAAKTPQDADFAVAIADAVLAASAAAGASDVHLTPTADGLDVTWRIDGVLQPLARVPQDMAGNVVTRLKVLARLLTYQTSVPQEGRIDASRGGPDGVRDGDVEVRVSTFPTVFGEKVVARNLPQRGSRLQRLDELALPADVRASLGTSIGETSGAIIVVGPAGSGKTTTAYACLREILLRTAGARSIATLEDPVESIVPGVAQSQVAEAAGFDLVTALRSLVRQDPEVILIGEIRDPQVASVAMQAALTGQLVITTFHASDAATAASRLLDMGVPPFVVRSGVRTIVAQRLLRRMCACATPMTLDGTSELLAITSGELRAPQGCDACRGTGYAGRIVVAEALDLHGPGVARSVLARDDAGALRAAALEAGMRPLIDQAKALAASGVTSVAEVVRAFGLGGEVRASPPSP